jgi:DNA mismatch repair protein MutS2
LIYPANFEEKTGFSRIRELIREQCLFEPGREMINDLQMMLSADAIGEQLDLVNELRLIQLSDLDFPIHQFHDSRKALKKLLSRERTLRRRRSTDWQGAWSRCA